jgi:hypothetical protein
MTVKHLKQALCCACWLRAGSDKAHVTHHNWLARRSDHVGRKGLGGGGSAMSMWDSGTM